MRDSVVRASDTNAQVLYREKCLLIADVRNEIHVDSIVLIF